jgi:hypothetical protein
MGRIVISESVSLDLWTSTGPRQRKKGEQWVRCMYMSS